MKSEKNGKPLAFTGEELETMHDHSGDDRLLFLLLRLTGLRLGEVVGLTWGEVSFDREQIACVQQKSPRKRTMRIPAELLSELRREHQRRNPQQNEPVLQNANGKPFTRDQLSRRIVRLGRRSGVHHALPYRFRQTSAYDLFLRGATPVYVGQALGVKADTVVKHFWRARRIQNAVDGGPSSRVWSKLRYAVLVTTFSRLANLARRQKQRNRKKPAITAN